MQPILEAASFRQSGNDQGLFATALDLIRHSLFEILHSFGWLQRCVRPHGHIYHLQSQLSPLMPALNRDASGKWTVTFSGAAPGSWQVWSRCAGSPDWSMTGELQTNQFPASDDEISPGGAWWQVKVCGEDGNGNQSTAFSNVISFGPVPS